MNNPTGKLIPIGGNEAKDQEYREDQDQDLNFNKGVLMEVISEMRKKHPVIEVLPIASQHQEEQEEIYREAFRKLGHKVGVIKIHNKEEVDNAENLERLSKCDGIFITGGDQSRLKKMLDDTHFLEIVKERYRNEPFVIAGTSAGAMILSEYMINTGSCEESLYKGIIKLTKGLGFLPGTIIDTHFFNRGRFARLTEALLQKKKYTGIGISEDTALVITGGKELRAIGSGTVVVIESDEIRNTNYDNIKEKQPVFIENLCLHILTRGTSYTLHEKKFRIL
jgi:cyanophycinase